MFEPLKRLAAMGTLLVVLCGLARGESPEVLVLMHEPGRVERYDLASGEHLGTLLSGLPPANVLLLDADGRLLISTGLPGGAGTVLRFDPLGAGRIETLIDIPEGYGGRLFRATGMAWHGEDLLVASQGDGKVKRYSYPAGEWQADIALASPGGMTQIAMDNGRLYLTDFVAHALRRSSEKLDGAMSEVWAQHAGQSPWGLVFDDKDRAYWSTSGNRVLRSVGQETVEWAGTAGGLNTPVGLGLGPDGLLYAANLHGQVTIWNTDVPQVGPPVRVIDGPEVKTPLSIAFTTRPLATKEFVYSAPVESQQATAEKLAFFESKIRPLLHTRCLDCHGAEAQEGGLRLDSRHGWEQGGESGTALAPGKPETSLLIKAVQYTDKDKFYF